VRNLVHELG